MLSRTLGRPPTFRGEKTAYDSPRQKELRLERHHGTGLSTGHEHSTLKRYRPCMAWTGSVVQPSCKEKKPGPIPPMAPYNALGKLHALVLFGKRGRPSLFASDLKQAESFLPVPPIRSVDSHRDVHPEPSPAHPHCSQPLGTRSPLILPDHGFKGLPIQRARLLRKRVARSSISARTRFASTVRPALRSVRTWIGQACQYFALISVCSDAFHRDCTSRKHGSVGFSIRTP
jgi:hypothetical protein